MSQTDFIIKARGLPWTATVKDVYTFFKDCNIVGDENGIHMTLDQQGRPSGECFVELASELHLEKAKAHNNEHMGERYIEISDAKRSEMEWFVSRLPGSGTGGGAGENCDGVVRLRGLPYEAAKKDIADFFSGIEIAPYGITITMDQDGRPSGEAYVEFTSTEEAEKALRKNKEKIGHRYIEIFNSSKADIKYVTRSNMFGGGFQGMGGRPGPYDRPVGFRGRGRGMNMGPSGFNKRGSGGPNIGGKNVGGGKANSTSKTGHMVHMRGLPFEATQGDVYQFLAPLNPVEVRLMKEESGRPKGECDVDFSTHNDAEAAMCKNKQHMGHRYIEMFLKSEPSYDNSWSNSAGYGQGGFGNMGGGGNYSSNGYGMQGPNSGWNTNYSSLSQSSGW